MLFGWSSSPVRLNYLEDHHRCSHSIFVHYWQLRFWGARKVWSKHEHWCSRVSIKRVQRTAIVETKNGSRKRYLENYLVLKNVCMTKASFCCGVHNRLIMIVSIISSHLLDLLLIPSAQKISLPTSNQHDPLCSSYSGVFVVPSIYNPMDRTLTWEEKTWSPGNRGWEMAQLRAHNRPPKITPSSGRPTCVGMVKLALGLFGHFLINARLPVRWQVLYL